MSNIDAIIRELQDERDRLPAIPTHLLKEYAKL
jgi:hypothetical protein